MIDSLSSAVRGRVLLAGQDGFDQAARAWNLAVAQQPAAVVEAADAQDVAALVRFAREAGLVVAAQPNGHGANGNATGAIVLRTDRLDDLRVDPDTRTARAGAGVKWGAVLTEAAKHGLVALAGSSPVVSVAGLTLGGGVSWFGRKYGWSADSVLAFEVVTAEGELARVTAGTDPDLFWALRGGGGDYALVTAIEFRLHPAPVLYGGRMVWPGTQAAPLLDLFREVTATAPDELALWYSVVQFPGQDPMAVLDLTYLGDAAEAAELLRPFEALGAPVHDSRGLISAADLGAITAEPTDPSPGKARALLLDSLDDVPAVLLDQPLAPLVGFQVRHLGGAFAQPSDSPHGPLTEPYLLYLLGVVFSPDIAPVLDARQRAVADALATHAGPRKPYTYLSGTDRAADAFSPDSLERLRQIKQARDPHGLIRANFPVLD
ncbi:FAD-binding oxidoreductase [Nonomuraea sp. NPDC050328]|uniref:FAD-binding oxidoreductase n=1 Tax=Nonomuraea sp. NPDC050328 TaxID=3364361 RepID=UPI00379330CD